MPPPPPPPQVTLDTVFTSVQSAVLAPLYLSPAHSARCVARAVSSSHTSGYTRTSQPVLLTQHYHQRCEEVEEGDGRRETELQLESYEHFAGGIEVRGTELPTTPPIVLFDMLHCGSVSSVCRGICRHKVYVLIIMSNNSYI